MNNYTKKKKHVLYSGIVLVILIFVFSTNYMVSSAYTSKEGTVSGNNVRSRTSPDTSTSSNILTHNGDTIYLHSGHKVTIVNETTASDGFLWYEVKFTYSSTEYPGYIRSDLITVNSGQDYTPDANFEAYLTAQGFPESYKNSLRVLHSKYPNWVFTAVQTGLNWNDVIFNESKVGTNLVYITRDDSCKSSNSAAYDWGSNKWYGFDGSSWVAASEGMISYSMDPRNFLDETNIFQFATLRYANFQNATGVRNILDGSFMSGNYYDTDGVTKSYADTFVDAGSSSGVNPYHLASRTRQEQGTNGTSGSISGTYPGYLGYFNYFNIGASPGGGRTSVENGLIYSRNQGWNSRYKSIVSGASFLANRYVNIGQDT